jgi:DNA-directed RNA polymerase specialized sigma24 family protein
MQYSGKMTREEYIAELVKCRESVIAYGLTVFPDCFSEDCVSEAITIALEKWKTYNGSCKVSTFVTRIYRFQQLQYYHYINRSVYLNNPKECYQVHTFDLEYIESKIALLTHDQRAAIERLIDGKKPRETAIMLNSTPGYVKSYNNKCRNRLRELINDPILLETHMPNEACAHHKQCIDSAA